MDKKSIANSKYSSSRVCQIQSCKNTTIKTTGYLLPRTYESQSNFSGGIRSSNNISFASSNGSILKNMCVGNKGNEPINMTSHITAVEKRQNVMNHTETSKHTHKLTSASGKKKKKKSLLHFQHITLFQEGLITCKR